MQLFTREEVVALLRRKQGRQSARDLASSLGISPQYLSDIYKGRRDPGPTILQYLDMEKTDLAYRKARP